MFVTESLLSLILSSPQIERGRERESTCLSENETSKRTSQYASSLSPPSRQRHHDLRVNGVSLLHPVATTTAPFLPQPPRPAPPPRSPPPQSPLHHLRHRRLKFHRRRRLRRRHARRKSQIAASSCSETRFGRFAPVPERIPRCRP